MMQCKNQHPAENNKNENKNKNLHDQHNNIKRGSGEDHYLFIDDSSSVQSLVSGVG